MYDSQKAEMIRPQGLSAMRETLRQRLEERKKAAEEHLADVNQALKFLDENPSFEAFHNLIGKAGF